MNFNPHTRNFRLQIATKIRVRKVARDNTDKKLETRWRIRACQPRAPLTRLQGSLLFFEREGRGVRRIREKDRERREGWEGEESETQESRGGSRQRGRGMNE